MEVLGGRTALELILLVVLLGFIAALLSFPRTFFMSRRCGGLYRRWLKESGLEEVSREDRFLFKGPFFWEPSAGFVVFRAVCKDATGATRSGFIRCGDHRRGLLGRHELEVRWDD